MSVRQKTLQALALAGVIAMGLFLAGCGGGGGGSSSNMMGGDMGGDMGDDMDDEMPMTMRNDLSLFMQANGMDQTFTAIEDDPTTPALDESMTVEQQRMAEAMAFGAELAEVAKMGQGRPLRPAVGNAPRQPTMPDIMVMWAAEDDPGTTTIDDSELRITINPDMGGFFGAPDLEIDLIDPNYRTIDGLDDVFMHGYEISRGGDNPADQARAIVFTDKQQGTAMVPAVPAVPAISAGELRAEAVTSSNVVMFAPGSTTIMDVMYFTDSTEAMDPDNAYTGTLTCTDSCGYTIADDGRTINVTGDYVFTGERAARTPVAAVEAVDPMENNDYLVFGLWLYETLATDTSPDGDETFGAFADGGMEITGDDLTALDTLTGQATYTGKAFGAHHMGGMISWFDADASIMINWDATPSTGTGWGTVTGEISNIQIEGGDMLEDSIYLGRADGGGIAGDATFTGTALRGTESRPGAGDHPFSGGWAGSLYSPGASGEAPDAVAGTFGVTNMDETETFVGAFGARMEMQETP